MEVKKTIKKIIGESNIHSIRQGISYIKNPENKKQICPLLHIKQKGYEVFCGYYDKNLVKNEKLLYLVAKENEKRAYINIFNLKNNTIQKVGMTQSWNWQQGCRLMWIPGEKKNMFSYNTYDERKHMYISEVVDLDEGTKKGYPWPVYDLFGNMEYALTLNFSRLGKMRPGYGYNAGTDKFFEDENGIWECDYKNLEKKIILKEKRILALFSEYEIKMNPDNCYINHISISPLGDKFMFFFIEIVEGKHKARLLLYNRQLDKLEILEKELIVSHYCWIDNNRLLITAYNDLWECGYYIYDGRTKKKLEASWLKKDGHPTYIGKGKIVTDTYPTANGMQELNLVDIDNLCGQCIAKVYHTGNRIEERRCDLHPKVDLKDNIIFIDTNIGKHREIYGVRIEGCKKKIKH